MSEWVLSVDFGTTNTAAAVAPVGRPEEVSKVKLTSASDEMPSGVLVDGDELVAGEVAWNMARAFPAAFEPTPKRRIGEPDVQLGGRVWEPVDLVAAVLSEVARRAAREFDGVAPVGLVLTHPAGWAATRRQVLSDAAGRAGLPAPRLVAEPVAAAAVHAARHGHSGEPIAVYDLGGGTFDIAVLSPTGDGYEVLATDMVDPLGGELFDEFLWKLVEQGLVEQGLGELVERLRETDALVWRRTLSDEVRSAKHLLSDRPSAPVSVRVEGAAAMVVINREQFHEVIAPELSRSIVATRVALELAGVAPDQLSRLCLTGGSTFIPLVRELLIRELGIEPATLGDPKLVTAVGAHLAATTAPGVELASARRVLAPYPELQRWVAEHPDAALTERSVFALATMPELLAEAVARPAVLAGLPEQVRFEPRPFPRGERSTEDPPPVVTALLRSDCPTLQQWDTALSEVAGSFEAARRLVIATEDELVAAERDPERLALLVEDASLDGESAPDWRKSFVREDEKPPDPPRPSWWRRRPSLLASGAALLVGLAVVIAGQWPPGDTNAPDTDPVLEQLYRDCELGDMAACDRLYQVSPSGSEYEAFGRSCGGRGTRPCVEETDPELEGLYDDCDGGDMAACDRLYFASPVGSDFEEFGRTCGGRGARPCVEEDDPRTRLETIFEGADLSSDACEEMPPPEEGPVPVHFIRCVDGERNFGYLEVESASDLSGYLEYWDARSEGRVRLSSTWVATEDDPLGQLRVYELTNGDHWALWTLDELLVAAMVSSPGGDATTWTYDDAYRHWGDEALKFDESILP